MDEPKDKALKKGDKKFERGLWWTCTDPDIERWVAQGEPTPDYSARVMFPGDRITVSQFIATIKVPEVRAEDREWTDEEKKRFSEALTQYGWK